MSKVNLCLFVLCVCAAVSAFAADTPITFDLAQKSDTQTVITGTYSVRVIHGIKGKTYVRPDGQQLPSPTSDPPACSDSSVKNDDIKSAKTEADLKKAIETFAKDCKTPQGPIDDLTAIPLGTFKISDGGSTTLTINDSGGGSPWTFTLRESHLDLDLAKSSAAYDVPPGEVKLRLINALPDQTYVPIPGDPKKAPAAQTLDKSGCSGIDDALKAPNTEATATAKISEALAKCTDAEQKDISDKVAKARRIEEPFATITAKAGEPEIVKVQREDKEGKKQWTFSVTGNGSKASPDDSANTPMAQLQKDFAKATISQLQPTTSVTCKVTDPLCPAIWVSASAQSLITITDVAAHYSGPVKVVVTTGETWLDKNGKSQVKPRTFIKTFPRAPAQIVISVHQTRGARKLPIADEYSPEPITESTATDDDFAIDFTTRGRSEQLAVTVIGADGKEHAINTAIKYQRWFVDTGGFITLTSVTDEELVTTATAGGVRVDKKRNTDKLTPGTGAVLDFHPANYPKWAVFQFGLATSQGRPLSYYLGTGYRVLEVGANALATAAFGLAAVPSTRFPDVKVSDVRAADDPALKGKTSYRVGPYISFSFGFRFGDVPPAGSNTSTAKPPATNTGQP